MEAEFETSRRCALTQCTITKLQTLEEVEARYGDWGLQQLEAWADEVAGDGGGM